MNVPISWGALETALYQEPLFLVEPPDGKKHLSELARVGEFRKLMRNIAPKAKVFANANAGRRSPAQAHAEGIVGGVFDYSVVWAPRRIAYPEFKGYTKAGRVGTLKTNQIEWGNAMHLLGHDVACFFDPMRALEWLRGLGCPMLSINNPDGRP